MKYDEYGTVIYQDHDIFDLMYQGITDLSGVISMGTPDVIKFNENSEQQISIYQRPGITVEEFDAKRQSEWLIPIEYQSFDIYEYCVNNCKTEQELVRCMEELVLFEKLNLIPVISVLKYIVDQMRAYNVLWGVGRGSSVASYVLYKLDIHRIDSIKYDLDYTEFLRIGE